VWPFDEKPKDQNAIEKYRRWLKRWLLNGRQSRQDAPEIYITRGLFFGCLPWKNTFGV